MRGVAPVSVAAALAIAAAGCGDGRPLAAAADGPTGCASCHTGPGEGPPFRDQTGSTDTRRLTVGAHDAHLHGNLSAPISCNECHTEPRSVADPGHLQDSPDDIRFGPLARTGGVTPSYVTQGCAASYCHGNFPGGDASNAPRWLEAGSQACGSCHALPPATGRHADHVGVAFQGAPLTCNTCHGPLVATTHVNGIKTVILPAWNPGARNCAAACHGAETWGP